MENTDHTSADLPSSDTLDAIRRNHAQRLLDMAEGLLQAFEAIDVPKDAVGLDRVGKALLTLNKVMDALHQNASRLAHSVKVQQITSDLLGMTTPDPAETLAMMKPYRAAQALRLEAIALKRAEAGQIDPMRPKPQKPRRYGP